MERAVRQLNFFLQCHNDAIKFCKITHFINISSNFTFLQLLEDKYFIQFCSNNVGKDINNTPF